MKIGEWIGFILLGICAFILIIGRIALLVGIGLVVIYFLLHWFTGITIMPRPANL